MKRLITIKANGRTIDDNAIFELLIGRKRIIHFELTPLQLGQMLLKETLVDVTLSDNNIKLIE